MTATFVPRREVLEVLYRARARVENPRCKVEFTDWTACTCGHIYAATKGRKARDVMLVADPDPDSRYATVIQEVARSLGWTPAAGTHPDDLAVRANSWVSVETSARADLFKTERSDVLATINDAIERIEEWEDEDRRNVLAQTRQVVDNVIHPEPVTT